MTAIKSILDENSKLLATIASLEARLQDIDKNMNQLSPAVQQIKQRNDSIVAAINYAIREYPSNPACHYLAGVMENFFKNSLQSN